MKKKQRRNQPFSIKEQLPFLRSLNKREKLSLFLGAGISASCGLPDWKTLLDCLKSKLIQEGYFISDSDDVADCARKAFKEKFNSVVADCIYSNGVNLSASIKAIAQSGINKIACFNFDDLLEEVLATECIEHRITLNGERFNLNKRGVTVFHPHGFLGRYDTDKEYTESEIVLSQSDYNSLYKDHYCLTNIIQLSFLINSSVLFIGMSLTDPNTLRLLKKTRELGVNHWHYALFKCKNEESQRNRTRELRNIGVDPIWFKDYTDIPKVLKRIRVNRAKVKSTDFVNKTIVY